MMKSTHKLQTEQIAAGYESKKFFTGLMLLFPTIKLTSLLVLATAVNQLC